MVKRNVLFASTFYQQHKMKCAKTTIGDYTYIGRVIGYNKQSNTLYKLIMGVTRVLYKGNDARSLLHKRKHNYNYIILKPKILYSTVLAIKLSEVCE